MGAARSLRRSTMAEPTPLFPRRRRRRSLALAVAAAGALVALLLGTEGPEPAYPEWATVTRALESDAWPLVTAARYDPANHFVLVDIRSDIPRDVAVRMACEDIRQLVDGVDSTAGFALYQAPDRVLAHRDDCADQPT